jgi:alkanesulfonate monooxygenase SsuD/methylene tetrahydromethanopterin reductase-like flavin-dependent oxidoreductase (luciferase family)
MAAGAATAERVPLSVLDLSPFASGQRPRDGLAQTLDLATKAEEYGYSRYWLAEHHANPGIAGSAPHVLAGLVAASTTRIRVGTAATIVAGYEPIQIAEASGVLAAAFAGRFDLGLGRTGSSRRTAGGAGGLDSLAGQTDQAPARDRVVDGLVLPAPWIPDFSSPRYALQRRLLGHAADAADVFPGAVGEILSFLAGDYLSADGLPVLATPAQDSSGLEVWIHGSTAGPSARLAGARGLRFGANYHVAPSFVLDAVAEYRATFVPSSALAEPHVIVSVDVVVGESDEAADEIAQGFAEWVLSIRSGQGAIPYPSPADARARVWTEAASAMVHDRVATRFVGSAETVVAELETLQRATGADELLITTITHDHRDRVESYRLLAEAWGLGA